MITSNIPADIAEQLLQRPPRLLQDGSGYNWKEFDRWMQQMWRLMGPPQSASGYNVNAAIAQNFDEQIDSGFVIDHSLDIQILRQRVEQLALEIDMITNSQNDIARLKKQINDIYVELGGAS